jgi:hypothetical protein
MPFAPSVGMQEVPGISLGRAVGVLGPDDDSEDDSDLDVQINRTSFFLLSTFPLCPRLSPLTKTHPNASLYTLERLNLRRRFLPPESFARASFLLPSHLRLSLPPILLAPSPERLLLPLSCILLQTPTPIPSPKPLLPLIVVHKRHLFLHQPPINHSRPFLRVCVQRPD